MEFHGAEPALPRPREVRITSPLTSLKRTLVALSILSAIGLVVAIFNFRVHFEVALLVIVTCAVLLLLALASLAFMPLQDPSEGPAIAKLLDAELRGTAADSEVFAYTLPPDSAKETVLRIWGVCGTKQQPAFQGCFLFECVWSFLIALGAFKEGYDIAFCMAGSIAVIIFWRVWRTTVVLVRRCIYVARVKHGMDVLLCSHEGSIRAWFCEYMAPSTAEYIGSGEEIASQHPQLEETPNGQALLRVVHGPDRDECSKWLQSLEWPCCAWPNRNLVYGLNVPADRKNELAQWLQQHRLIRGGRAGQRAAAAASAGAIEFANV